MKLLIFAHTPPPHHGQSYMVKLMLEGLGGDVRRPGEATAATGTPAIECYHVNCRYSDNLEDIGSIRLEKSWLVMRYCLEAIWCRLRYNVQAFYYVPAPGKRAALYRDWMVMLICRPFFRHVIHHWHAVGLGDWLGREGSWFERWLTHRLLGRPALGIALAIPSMRDPLWFRSRRVEVVANGIPDPCPDFDAALLPRRRARASVRRKLLASSPPTDSDLALAGDAPEIFRVLYLAHCTREKGVFDTVDGVVLANAQWRAANAPLRMHLTIAGAFLTGEEERAFHTRLGEPDVAGAPLTATYAGFVSGAEKARLLRESDAFCFPTYFPNEGQPVNLLEAMAHGLPIVTTRWRAIPDTLPADDPGFVPPLSPSAVAEKLRALSVSDDASAMRAAFLASFTEQCYFEALHAALSRVRS